MNATNKWKIASAILAICCVALVYRVIDQGMTKTYLDASQETSANHIKLLTNLVEHEWLGMSEEQVMSRLKSYVASQTSDTIVLKRETESNIVFLEGIRFQFSDGKLTKVL